VERQLLELKARKPLWGAPKLRCKLLAFVGPGRFPAESTISEILRRHGLSRVARWPHRTVPTSGPLSHCQTNQVWCPDFKGWFRSRDGEKCTPLTITDGHSRYLLCCQGLSESIGELTVKPLFVMTFRANGVPGAIRTDNRSPFARTGLWRKSRIRLGVGRRSMC